MADKNPEEKVPVPLPEGSPSNLAPSTAQGIEDKRKPVSVPKVGSMDPPDYEEPKYDANVHRRRNRYPY